MVEVLGRYSNHSYQGKRLANLVEIAPHEPRSANTRTPKQVQRRLRPSEIRTLVAAYQAGATMSELATQFQIHRGTVGKLLKQADVPRRYRLISPAQLEDLITDYRAGASLSTLSAQTGFARTTIRYALNKAAVQLRPRPGWRY